MPSTNDHDPGLLADSLAEWNAAGRPGATQTFPPRSAAEAGHNIARSHQENSARLADDPAVRSARVERRRERNREDRAEARAFAGMVPADALLAGEDAVCEYLTANQRPWPRRRILQLAVGRARHRAEAAEATA